MPKSTGTNTGTTLAMAAFPKQEWCTLYDYKSALAEGTIFPCLNLTFFKAPFGDSDEVICPCDENADETQQDRETLMTRISEISFSINDLTLYLDTHPTCENGLTCFRELLQERMKLLAEYARKYNPLTESSIATGGLDTMIYGWDQGPMPWEGACI